MADRAEVARGLATTALAHWTAARCVAAYLSVGGEPGTGPLLAALAARGTRVLVPVVTGEGLDWAVHDPAAGAVVVVLRWRRPGEGRGTVVP